MKWFGLNILGLILALALPLLTASCGVTETGNPGWEIPEAGGGEEDSCSEDDECFVATAARVYINDTYGIEVKYPADWDVEGAEGGNNATFFSEESMSFAFMSFSIPFPALSSLEDYLEQRYPTRIFDEYSTDTLAGFIYDNPEAGSNGGDLFEYFFYNNSVLIHIIVNVFVGDEADIESLLDGMEFI